MTMLFMIIDANSDGTVDWDEFTSYMMVGSMEEDGIVSKSGLANPSESGL